MHLVRSGAITGFEAMVSQKGYNPIHLLEQVGFSSAQLRDPNTYVSYVKLADLLDLASEQCNDPYFSLRLASTHTPMFWGDLAYPVGLQPTVGESMRYALEHMNFHAEGVHLEEQQVGDFTLMKFGLDFNNASGLHQLMQLSIAQAANMWFVSGPPHHRFRMHLQQHKPPAQASPVAKYDPYLVFNSNFDGSQFPTAWLSREPDLDPVMLRDYFQRQVQSLEGAYPDNLAERLRYLLSNALPSGDCTIARMAASLNLHPRVLQKRLKLEDTSFTRLLRETRQDIACQHLQHNNISITDLALKLGYAEVAIFSRHFKRWTGLSPRQWRQQRHDSSSPSKPR